MPGKREPSPRPKHDASYRSFFARRRTVADTLRAVAADIARHLDFVTLERMHASFVTRALDQRHADMLAPVPEALLGYLPRHRYLLIEIQAADPAALPPDNVLAMIAKFEQAPTAEALDGLVASLPDWFKRARLPEFAEPLLTWVTHVLTQRHGDRGKELQRKLKRGEEPKMTTLIERARQWGRERDEEWLQKGLEKGIKEERRASLQRERKLVHRLVKRRFGPDTAEQLIPLLDRLSEPGSIVNIADAVVECGTAEEFLKRVREA